jgi:hypothetical protein
MRQVGIALFTVLLLSTTLPLRASAQSLSRIIQDSRSDIEVRNGHLVGPGEVEIREAVSHACYIFLGEDHGIAEVPEFAEGITNISMGDGIRTLALEISPSVAEQLSAQPAGPGPMGHCSVSSTESVGRSVLQHR